MGGQLTYRTSSLGGPWGPGRNGESGSWVHSPKSPPLALPSLRADPHSVPQLSVQSYDLEHPLELRWSGQEGYILKPKLSGSKR